MGWIRDKPPRTKELSAACFTKLLHEIYGSGWIKANPKKPLKRLKDAAFEWELLTNKIGFL